MRRGTYRVGEIEALLGSLKAVYGPRRARWILDEKEGMSRDTRELNCSYSACA